LIIPLFIDPSLLANRPTGPLGAIEPQSSASLFFVDCIIRKRLQPGRQTAANASAVFYRNKKATTLPVLLDGNLRGLDLRIIRCLKSKRQASACPLNMSHIPIYRHGQPIFYSLSCGGKRLHASVNAMYFAPWL